MSVVHFHMDIKNHLISRHLNLELHRPVIDEIEQVATFYLWNLSGNLVGYQQYRPHGDKTPGNNPKNGKYFTLRKQPTLAVWGVESIHLRRDVLFLTEGIFDAARLTNRGFPAVAALSNDPTPDLANWLWCLNRRVIAVCDNDKAGERLADFGNIAVFTDEKDLGDSDESYVSQLLKKFG